MAGLMTSPIPSAIPAVLKELNLRVNVTYGDTNLHDDNGASTNLILFVFWGIFLPLVATVGLIGNTLTIIVLWRKEMHSTTILYLRGLVITDTGILIGSVLALTPISCANYLQGDALVYFKDHVYPVIHTPAYYLVMTLQQCNVWITVSVSMERYISICHPFRASRLISRRKTLLVILVIAIVSLIYNIPHLLASEATPCPSSDSPEVTVSHTTASNIATAMTTVDADPGLRPSEFPATDLPVILPPPLHENRKNCLIVGTTEFGNTEFYKVYRTIMYTILIYVIPFLALVVLNSFLIKELMTMQKRRAGTNIHEENEANLSLVLVLIVIVFIFCQTPGLVSQFDVISVDAFICWLAVSNLLFTANSAVNFLIYTAFGRKFRHVLLRVFRHVFHKNRGFSQQSSFRTMQYTLNESEDTVDTVTRCPSLGSLKCYKKECKSPPTSQETMPLNHMKGENKPTLLNNGNYINAKRQLSPMPELRHENYDDSLTSEQYSTGSPDEQGDFDTDVGQLKHNGRNYDAMNSTFPNVVPTDNEASSANKTKNCSKAVNFVNNHEIFSFSDHSSETCDDRKPCVREVISNGHDDYNLHSDKKIYPCADNDKFLAEDSERNMDVGNMTVCSSVKEQGSQTNKLSSPYITESPRATEDSLSCNSLKVDHDERCQSLRNS